MNGLRKDTLDLRLTCPTFAPRHYSLTDERITIGRSTSCTISISDRYLSRQHAEITRVDGQWFVTDGGSVNGTLLNDVPLRESTLLRPGDRITIGDNQIHVLAEDVPAMSAVMMPSSHS